MKNHSGNYSAAPIQNLFSQLYSQLCANNAKNMHNTGKSMSESTVNYYCSSVLLILETHPWEEPFTFNHVSNTTVLLADHKS